MEYHIILLVSCIVPVNCEIWPYAVASIAQNEFPDPCVLLLLTSRPNRTKYSLVVKEDSDFEMHLIQWLNYNWTTIISNHAYHPPAEEIGLYRIKRTKQIVMVLNEDIVKDSQKMKNELKTWKLNPAWSGQSKFIVLIRCNKQYDGMISLAVLYELWLFARVSHVVCLETYMGDVFVYSWEPYSLGCEPKLINFGKFDIMNPPNNVFGKMEYRNLNRCPIVAACSNFVPYVIENQNGEFTDGFEIMIFEALSKMLNFRIEYVTTMKNESPFDTYQNGEPAGLIGMLHRLEADFAFSGMRLMLDRYRLVDVIDSYYGDNYVWAAPLKEKVKSWRSFIIVFQFSMWFGILIIFFIVSLIIKLLSNIGFGKAGIIACAIGTNTAIKYPSTGFILRLFLASYFIYVLNVTAAYQSELIGILTNGISQVSAENFEDAVEGNFFVNIFPSMAKEVKAAYPDTYSKIVSTNQVNWTNDYLNVLRKISRQEHKIAMLPDTLVKYEVNQRFTSLSGKRYIRWLSNRYGPYQPVFFMPKDHPMQTSVRTAVRRLVENGCVQHFVKTVLDKAMTTTELCEVSDLEDYNEQRVPGLSLEQTIGAFVILLSTLLISIIIFIFELVWHSIVIQKRYK